MKILFRNIIVLLVILLSNRKAFSTHVVGGSLTYRKTGVSTYVITLKLYRDCSLASNLALPGFADVEIRGPYGVTFSPNKIVSLPRISITVLNPVIDTCVIDPGVCVQEGIYQATVNNLPNDVAYHMYYQVCCRNHSINNVVDPGDVGESFYAYIPSDTVNSESIVTRSIWLEDFNLSSGATIDSGTTKWSRTYAGGGAAQVNVSKTFIAQNTTSAVTWLSEPVNIAAYPGGVDLSMQLFNSGNLEAGDSLKSFYSIDGGAFVAFPINGDLEGTFLNGISAEARGIIGTTVTIKVVMKNNFNNEHYYIDNVAIVRPPTNVASTINNSNPVFNNFPPIFVCVSETLDVDYSASDSDGDSLAYSFYRPYNSTNPSYSSNDSIIFPTIPYVAGYTYTTPLGAGSLVLNPQTGMLTVQPSTIGQFVVGVLVREYRNGILIGYNSRDFQFNVLYCPPIATAIIDKTLPCNDSTLTASSQMTADSYHWDFGVSNTLADTARTQSVVYNYPDTGSYIVRLITNYQTPCADTTFDTVKVKWINVDFSYSAILCTYDSILFTHTSTYSNNIPGFQYTWDLGNSITSSAQNPKGYYTATGSYDIKLEIDDGDGCLDSITKTINILKGALLNAIIDQQICSNEDALTLTSSGNNIDSIHWHTNGSGNIVDVNDLQTDYLMSLNDTNLAALYFIAIAYANSGCAGDTDTTFITLLSSPTLVPDTDKTICFGAIGTNVYATATGGTAPYHYLWNTNDTVSPLFVGIGTYISQITDANGCQTEPDTVVVDQIAVAIAVNISGGGSLICVENLPISATAHVTGASGVLWDGSGSYNPAIDSLNILYTPNNAEITAGFATLTVQTTGNGTCAPAYDTAIVFITSILAAKDSVLPGCDLFNGSATITPSGGATPYLYAWSANANGQITPTIVGITAGIYSVTVTDQDGCKLDTSFRLLNTPPVLNISSIKNSTCYGGTNGTATVVASGGVPGPGYTYQWDSAAFYQTTNMADSLQAGTYFVTTTDSINCKASISVTIGQPTDSITTMVATQTANICFGDSNGTANLSTSGGNGGPFTYAWDTSPIQTDSFATGLSATTYHVTVYDDSLCSNVFDVQIQEPPMITLIPSILSDYNGQNISCPNDSDATISVSASGGTPGYTYQWNDSQSQTTAIASGISEGTYTVVVKDSHNCEADTSIIVTDPDSIVINMLINSNYNGADIKCYGDSNAIVGSLVSGGTPGYTYQWNDYQHQTTDIATQVPAGTYTLVVTDANNCKDSNLIVVTQPQPLSVALTSTDVSCFGSSDGTATASPAGGTIPYQYLWDTTALSQTTATASLLESKYYLVTITDTNSCQITDSVLVNSPSPVLVTALADDTICPGSFFTLSANAAGGNGVYTYSWNNGVYMGQTVNVLPAQTSFYTVIARDQRNCASEPDTVVVNIRIFAMDSLDLVSGGNICFGDSTTLEALYHGNYGPYTYTWNNGVPNGIGPHTIRPTDTTLYTVTVRDVCNNQINKNITVEVYPIPVISLDSTIHSGCQPLHIYLSDTAHNPNIYQYIWKIKDDTTLYGNNLDYYMRYDGTYHIQLSMVSLRNCTAQFDTSHIVTVFPSPIVACVASPSEVDTDNPLVSFTTDSLETYHWDFGVDSLDNDTGSHKHVKYTYPDTGTYIATMIGYNQYGCSDTCQSEIIVKPVIKVLVPNVFIPNPTGPGGGLYNANSLTNDVFFPVIKYLTGFHMMIFSRWGEMVFETYDINIGWDGYFKGQLCQQDVYVWKIEASFTDGKSRELIGDLTLLR